VPLRLRHPRRCLPRLHTVEGGSRYPDTARLATRPPARPPARCDAWPGPAAVLDRQAVAC